jgi:hypothetical protein
MCQQWKHVECATPRCGYHVTKDSEASLKEIWSIDRPCDYHSVEQCDSTSRRITLRIRGCSQTCRTGVRWWPADPSVMWSRRGCGVPTRRSVRPARSDARITWADSTGNAGQREGPPTGPVLTPGAPVPVFFSRAPKNVGAARSGDPDSERQAAPRSGRADRPGLEAD